MKPHSTVASGGSPSLSALHAMVVGRLRRLVRVLPITPPSLVVAQVLNSVLLPRIPDDARQWLSNRSVEIQVIDVGLRVRLQLRDSGFKAAPTDSVTALRILAPAASYLRLMRGNEDADRLFFERCLVMEGDTEMGVALKNMLDAIGPLLKFSGGRGGL